MAGDGFDRLSQRAERAADRAAGNLADHPKRTAAKWGAWLIGIVVLLAIVGGIIGFAGDWGGEAKRVISPQNAREQTTAILDDWTSLEATAGNVCNVRDARSNSDSPTLVEDPAFAYKAKYRSIKADYDRRMGNFFEGAEVARLPLPDALHSYPRQAPPLPQMEQRVC